MWNHCVDAMQIVRTSRERVTMTRTLRTHMEQTHLQTIRRILVTQAAILASDKLIRAVRDFYPPIPGRTEAEPSH